MIKLLLSWIRSVVKKLISRSSVKQALKIDTAISNKMADAISLWSQMYADESPWLDKNTKSLNLASGIASEMARLTTIELKSEITGSPRADYLNEQYKRFLGNIRTYCEYGCAKGGLALKPYIDGDKIAIDIVQADRFFPTSFDSSGNLTGGVFVEQITKGQNYFTRFEYHNLTDVGYQVMNSAYKSTSRETVGNQVTLVSVEEWAGLESEVLIENIYKPLFGYFKIPLANTEDDTSPLGVSVYARAVDLIKEADKQYSRTLWEMEGGELAIDADETVFKKDAKTGKLIMPKGKERLFRALDIDSSPQGGNKSLTPFSPELRDQSLINVLNKLFQRIEFNCGLAYGTISDPQNIDKTATEIRNSKQRSYATVADIQKALQSAIESLLYAMDIWATIGKLAPAGKYEISFEWDDSIVVDTQAEGTIRMQEVASGILKPEYYLMWRYGVTENQAREMMPEMKDLTQ